MFNDSIKNSFTLSFDSWSTDRKTVETQLEYQVDIGSAQNITSPNFLIAVRQTAARIGASNKAEKVAIFDHLDDRKHHVDIDGVLYPRKCFSIDDGENYYVDQYRDLSLYYKEYLGEDLLSPFISFTDMKNNYPIQLFDLRFQVDHINSKKKRLFGENRGAINNARLFLIKIRHRGIKMISDGKFY